jgi:DNA modification methylase
MEELGQAARKIVCGTPRSRGHVSVALRTVNPYPVDTSAEVQRLIGAYKGSPVPVSFREMVSWIRVGERATHYLHTYPAKLLPQIAHFFLAASSLSRKGDTVLDPFGGTGTVALEALLAGRKALQADANPLARLIAQVKTRMLSEAELTDGFAGVETRFKLARACSPPPVVNIDYWYARADIRALSRLKTAILGERSKPVRDFMLVTFSAVARRVSRADPRFSVPVRRGAIASENQDIKSRVWEQFDVQFRANAARFSNLRRFGFKSRAAHCAGADARHLANVGEWDAPKAKPLADASVDLIITSPPYAGAQKYIRASSLSLGWLGFAGTGQLRTFERRNIGREHLDKCEVDDLPKTGLPNADAFIGIIAKDNRRRGAIIAIYLVEMKAALAEAVRVLKPGGHFVLVIGDNQVCGREFTSSAYLTEILTGLGLTVRLKLMDEIRSRGLITKRHATAGIIAREWVIVLQKPERPA